MHTTTEVVNETEKLFVFPQKIILFLSLCCYQNRLMISKQI